MRWSVSCCSDGDIVDVYKGVGGGFEERRKEGKTEERLPWDASLQMCRKRVGSESFRACRLM